MTAITDARGVACICACVATPVRSALSRSFIRMTLEGWEVSLSRCFQGSSPFVATLNTVGPHGPRRHQGVMACFCQTDVVLDAPHAAACDASDTLPLCDAVPLLVVILPRCDLGFRAHVRSEDVD